MKRFLIQLFSNPDGSASTKRTMAFTCLLAALLTEGVVLFHCTEGVNEMIVITFFCSLLGASLGALGISSIDVRSFYNNGNSSAASQAASQAIPNNPSEPINNNVPQA